MEKQEIIKKFAVHPKDTGSPEVQVALISDRINNLSDHLKAHKKDKHSRRGLIMMVSQRRKLLKYLSSKSPIRYQQLIDALKIRS